MWDESWELGEQKEEVRAMTRKAEPLVRSAAQPIRLLASKEVNRSGLGSGSKIAVGLPGTRIGNVRMRDSFDEFLFVVGAHHWLWSSSRLPLSL
jgi:hypothetical protein